jgi:acyl-CoA hydrolase
MENTEELERTVSYSRTECTYFVKNEDINGKGRLFGGRLMQWIDEVSSIACRRHCGMPITTAAVDNLRFKEAAKVNDIIVLIAKVSYVGNTSMECRVDSYREDSSGIRTIINRAYLTCVALNEDDKPTHIPYKLKLENENDKAEWEGALKRIEYRKYRRSEGF